MVLQYIHPPPTNARNQTLNTTPTNDNPNAMHQTNVGTRLAVSVINHPPNCINKQNKTPKPTNKMTTNENPNAMHKTQNNPNTQNTKPMHNPQITIKHPNKKEPTINLVSSSYFCYITDLMLCTILVG